MYLEAGVELTIPDFEGDDLGVSYDAESGKYTITNATQEDAVNFYNALAEAGWSVTELSGNYIDFTATYGPYASIKVDDWINTSRACLYITFTLSQEAEFPMDVTPSGIETERGKEITKDLSPMEVTFAPFRTDGITNSRSYP